jgi:hydroxyacylglutathione hydrolase
MLYGIMIIEAIQNEERRHRIDTMKTRKKIWIGIALVIAIFLLAGAGFFLKFYLEIRGMTPAETSRIDESAFCIKDMFVNAFVFKGKTGYLLVDAGMNEGTMKDQLAKLGIKPEQVTAILLTHTDSDHTGAVALFKNARIFMHRDEEQMINGKNGKFFFMRMKWKYGPYLLFDSNDTLVLDGLNVRVIHTPGHTPGSCCFLINHDYLATGDNLAYINGRVEHFVDFFNMNTRQQDESIKAMPDLKSIKYILTAHHGIIKNFP